MLARLKAQIYDVKTTAAATRRQIQALEDSLRESEAWLADLVPRHDALSQSVSAQRVRISPLSFFPVDVLGHIFRMQAFERDPLAPEIAPGTYNFGRAVAPFRVAAVSSHWRSSALNTPDIWHYVGVKVRQYFGDAEDKAILGYLDDVLRRSGCTTLDVIFSPITDTSGTAVPKVLAKLYHHMARWRMFELTFEAGQDSYRLLEYLRGPAPCLEVLRLTQLPTATPSALQWPSPFPPTMTGCSRLKVLVVRNLPWAFGERIDRTALMRLVFFTQSIPATLLWNALRAAPNLKQMWLAGAVDLSAGQPTEPVQLPELWSLNLLYRAAHNFADCAGLLRLSALRELFLDCRNAHTVGSLGAFLEQCKDSLSRLTLRFAVLEAGDIQTLRPLKKIEHLELRKCAAPGQLFDLLHDDAECMMPGLLDLVLYGVVIEPHARSSALVNLVRARNPTAVRGDAPWSRLRRVEFDDATTAPLWERAEIARLVAP